MVLETHYSFCLSYDVTKGEDGQQSCFLVNLFSFLGPFQLVWSQFFTSVPRKPILPKIPAAT